MRRTAGVAVTLCSLASVLALVLASGPALAQTGVVPLGTTTTSTTSTTTPPLTAPPGPPPPPPRVVVDPNNASQQMSEVGPAEAQLLALLDTVHSRLASLDLQMQSLNSAVAQNQAALAAANQALAEREAEVAAADQRLADLGVAIAAAHKELQERAIAAYIRQPTGELAALLLHLESLSDLVDVQAYYHALVDAQVKTVVRYDALRKAAVQAAKQATAARDQAKRQQQAVAAQQTRLDALRATFQLIARESQDQQAQQQALLGQASIQKAAFEAAVKQLQAESDAVEALLRQIESSQGPPGQVPPAQAGLLAVPIPGAAITSPFGPRVDPFTGDVAFHPGVDFGANLGVPIEAAADGTVVWAGPNGGYGNCTIIDHGHGLATLYAHQSRLLVQVGDQVTRGEVIGQVGSTGYSTGPHLHFEVRANGTPVDPVPYL